MTDFSKSVPKVPNSGGKSDGRFSHRAKNESYQKQKQLRANDISYKRRKKYQKYIKKIKPWVDIKQKRLRIS